MIVNDRPFAQNPIFAAVNVGKTRIMLQIENNLHIPCDLFQFRDAIENLPFAQGSAVFSKDFIHRVIDLIAYIGKKGL